MRLLIICLLIYSSCDVPKQIINTEDLAIELSKTECGSYEVKNKEKSIGYVVKPFVIEMESKENCITQFEYLLKSSQSHYYDKFYRVYWFIRNSAADTVLEVAMLSPKQVGLIPNWQCEAQDVDMYKSGRKKLFDAKRPQFFTYNYSKARFKILGDPD